MIEIPGKGKGRLCSGGLDRLPYILIRAKELLEQRRREGIHENEAGEATQNGAHPTSNGETRTPIATPAPLSKP